jgi:hypothetical protein
MTRRRAALLAIVQSMVLLCGCASVRETPVDTGLFPRNPSPTESRAPGRLAVVLQPAVRDMVHQGDEGPAQRMRLPIGRIVAQAMLMSADDAFAEGAQRVDEPATSGAGFGATLVIQSARVSYHSRLLWFLPLPVLGGAGDLELDARLALDVSLLDAQGQMVWTRSYDSGRQIWEHSWDQLGYAQDGLVRLTHEMAWRLSQQAVRELREWMQAERMRPRTL